MRKRIGIALSGAGVAAVLGLLLLFGGIVVKPISAVERMAENIRKAKSFSAVMIGEGRDGGERQSSTGSSGSAENGGVVRGVNARDTCWRRQLGSRGRYA